MATYTSSYADIRINDTSRFRTQGQWVSDTLTTMGWTKTSDTGQIDWTTVNAPTTDDTSQGYEIRSNGTLYFRIQYGSGYGAYAFSLWLQFGPGSDGSGNISNPYTALFQLRSAAGYNGASAKTGDFYMSGDDTRIMLCLNEDTTPIYGVTFTLEPSRDLDGDEDGLGWYFNRANYGPVGDVRWIGPEGTSLWTDCPGYVRLPRALGSAGVYVPICVPLAPNPKYGYMPLRDSIMVASSLVASQATLSVNGRTYLNVFGATNSPAVWGFTAAYTCALLLRYD